MNYRYVIVGGGLAGGSAVAGIREHDSEGRILLLSMENHPPYHRPPLSKDLWFGKKKLSDLPLHPEDYYAKNNVELALRREAVEIDPESRVLWDDHGTEHHYDKLLLATGGRPKPLAVEGADLDTIHYFRYLEDYLYLETHLERIRSVLVIGGGFIGVELAAALAHAGRSVILVYPEDYPLRQVLPRDLGEFVAEYYRSKGVETVSGESVATLMPQLGTVRALMRGGLEVQVDLVVAGVGIRPATDLADAIGLEVDDGILVDEQLRTSHPDIYAAGDVAEFPCQALGERMRVEHWDNAIHMGQCAGANMAGAGRTYDHLPMFFSDQFDLGWEAVGKVDSRLQTIPVWKEPFREGIVYYVEEGQLKGVLLWNVWERVEWARDLIASGKSMSTEELTALAAL